MEKEERAAAYRLDWTLRSSWRETEVGSLWISIMPDIHPAPSSWQTRHRRAARQSPATNSRSNTTGKEP